MLDKVAPDRPGWRRHVTALGLLVAVVVATLGFAKPVIAGEVTSDSKLVILAIDTSISMEATDVPPTRADAARDAAGSFLDSVPEGVAVGVIAFDGNARQLIAPTTNLEGVRGVIDRAIQVENLGEGTAIGEAVFLGVDAIEGALVVDGDGEESDEPVGTIVLLSDGDTTMGRPNDEAASAARAAGVPVHTIAFGTDSGTINDPLVGSVPVPVNEAALEQLAHQTDGQALTAATADQLSEVYEGLGQSVTVEREQVEISDWFAGAAMAVLCLAGVGSLVWSGRLP
jgi:Ca-activated chloride channel family protein